MEFDGITLVTGAAGFMGSHMVEHLANKGVKVRATARPRKETPFFDALGVEFVGADLTRPETIPPLFEGDVDRVIHMGAICNFSTPFEKLRPTNVVGVERITKLAMEAGVKRYVHVGSTSAYGPYRGRPFQEDDPRDPQDDYGRSKRDGEDVVLKRIAEGLPSILTRPCTVYGPRCTEGAGKAFSRPTSISAIPGKGTQLLSNIRAEDVAGAVDHLSHLDDAVGKAFNLAEDTHPTVGESLVLAAKAFGQKPPKLHAPLFLVKNMARVQGWTAARKGRIPDLEFDAVAYLYDDYIVDNSRLKATGYEFIYPDFYESMRQIKELYESGRCEIGTESLSSRA
jgi:nucleoside-diphosphate-sugar epimerase